MNNNNNNQNSKTNNSNSSNATTTSSSYYHDPDYPLITEGCDRCHQVLGHKLTSEGLWLCDDCAALEQLCLDVEEEMDELLNDNFHYDYGEQGGGEENQQQNRQEESLADSGFYKYSEVYPEEDEQQGRGVGEEEERE